MNPDPYASIQRLITLPRKHNISKDAVIFNPIENVKKEGGYELSQSLLTKTNSLIEELNHTFEVYDNPKNFRFSFPESMFPPVGENQTNRIQYEQKMITEQQNTFKNRLSEQQLKEIQETGEFKVKSNVEYITLPYVWKINQALFWGKKKILKEWMQSLAKIFGYFWTANKLIKTQIPIQWAEIKRIPSSLFQLFFGKKSIQPVFYVDYQRELYKDFWSKIMRQYYQQNEQWFNALWKYLYVFYDPEMVRAVDYSKDKDEYRQQQRRKMILSEKYNKAKQVTNQKIQAIFAIDASFNHQWAKMKKKMIIDITEEISAVENSIENRPQSEEQLLLKEEEPEDNLKDQKILQKLAEKRFSLYLDHFKAELPKINIPLDVVNAIVLILRLFTVIDERYARLEKSKRQRRRAVEGKVRKQYPIKSLFNPFFNSAVNEQMDEISKTLEDELYRQLLNDREFTNFLDKHQIQAYRQFLKLRKNWDVLISAKKLQVPQYHAPTRIFHSNYRLIPSQYKIIKEENYYSLKKVSDDLTVDTSQDFWKLRLYWMRLKTWTINCLVYLSFSVWKGPIGVRALWGTQDYNCDMYINSQTGEIRYHQGRTVLGTFNTVIEGIEKSRKNFQDTPDLGLLGKNVSRIFNYFECYVFRFFFVGVLLVLIGFPILIVVASAVTLALVLTFWAWMPLILAVTYLFNIFLKQFETALDRYGFWSRTFPLFVIVIRLVINLLVIVVVSLNLIVVVPLRSGFWLTVAVVVNLFRRVFDKIMMCVFTKLGRTPSRDTFVARKISGPGMSKDFYMSINEEDVYILIRSNLQQRLMQKMNHLTTQKIETHGRIFDNVINKILEPFGAHYNKRNYAIENKEKLMQNYQKQYRQYMNRYPNNPYNVRFTQEQIDSYFPNTVKIVANFVEKNEIRGWIFEEYQLYEDMYDDLTRNVWMEIFQCGQEIFQPLEKLDTRFKLEDQYKDDDVFSKKMKKGVGSVMKALEGQVKFQHHQKKLSPFKHSLLSRERSVANILIVLEAWRNNSLDNSVYLNINQLRTFFIPNLNIKEAIIVDHQQRLHNIRNQKNIIDL